MIVGKSPEDDFPCDDQSPMERMLMQYEFYQNDGWSVRFSIE